MGVGGFEDVNMLAVNMPTDVPLFAIDVNKEAFHGAYESFMITHPCHSYRGKNGDGEKRVPLLPVSYSSEAFELFPK